MQRGSRAIPAAVWAVLTVAAILPFAVAPFPPLYDYYHWVFEAHVFSALAFGAGGAQQAAIERAYNIYPAPIPNMVATVGIALLDTVLSPLASGRVFATLTVLLVSVGFGFLARSLQGRPTAVELLAFPFAFGFFLYKGYLSYLFSVGLAFFALAVLHRSTRGGSDPPGPRASAGLAALAVVLFLSHVVGWAVFAAGVASYAAFAAPSSRSRAMRIALPLCPSLLPLVWYTIASAGESQVGIVYYDSILDKLRALVQSWLLFVRTDPIPPPFPTLAASALALLLLVVVLVSNIEARHVAREAPRALRAVALFLVALALVLPIVSLSAMLHPDSRLLLPAFLIAVATLPGRRLTVFRAAVAGGAVLAILLAHAAEYRRASRFLSQVNDRLEAVVPRDKPGLSITITRPRLESGCEGETGTLLGRTETLRWIGLVHMLRAEGVKLSLMSTSVVDKNFGHDDLHDLKSILEDRAHLPELADVARESAGTYAYAEVFGCPNDVRRAEAVLAPRFRELERGYGFAILESVKQP